MIWRIVISSLILFAGDGWLGEVRGERLRITDFYLESIVATKMGGAETKLSKSDFRLPVPVLEFRPKECLFRVAKGSDEYWIHGRWVEVEPSTGAVCDPEGPTGRCPEEYENAV